MVQCCEAFAFTVMGLEAARKVSAKGIPLQNNLFVKYWQVRNFPMLYLYDCVLKLANYIMIIFFVIWHLSDLTSSLQDKMAPIWQTTFYFQRHFLKENNRITIQIPLKCVPISLIDNKPALVQVMVWRRTGAKPLHEPMMTQFTDAYMRHYMRWWVNHISPQ